MDVKKVLYLISQKIHCKTNIQNSFNPIIHFIYILRMDI